MLLLWGMNDTHGHVKNVIESELRVRTCLELGVVVHGRDPRILEVEARGSEIYAHRGRKMTLGSAEGT